MIIHRLTALAIVATFSTFLRISLVPAVNRMVTPAEVHLSTLSANASVQIEAE